MFINLYDKNFYNLSDYEGEIWKPIEMFGGEFYASNYGRIKRTSRTWGSGRKQATIKTEPESIVKVRQIPDGYTKCTICYNKQKKSYAVHRLIAITFLENPNNLREVNHKDGDKTNNMLENLEWCSRSDNQKHAIHVLRDGHLSIKAKRLTQEQVSEIKKYKLENPSTSYNELCKMFGITFSQAYGLIKHNYYSEYSNKR